MNKNKITAILCLTAGAGIISGTFLEIGTTSSFDSKDASNAVFVASNTFDTERIIQKPLAFATRQSSFPASVVSEQVEVKPLEVIVDESQKDMANNPIKLVKDSPVSTFSIDTDDGSYKLFSSYLQQGKIIDQDLIRPEEFINAFSYNYEKPMSIDSPFATSIEVVDSPWSKNKILKVGIQGYEVDFDTLPDVNLVFLVDVSGSMRLEMAKIKLGLKSLVNKLRPNDKVSIVTYAGSTETVLPSTRAKDLNAILGAIDNLNTGGGTNGESGIKLAYNEAEKGLIQNGINRILLISDGDFNVGINNQHDLKKLIKEKRESGVTFSTIGISEDSSYRDSLMESMANHGNGNYTFIGSIEDAREVFADRFVSTLVNIAKDVKTQIEFNPQHIKEYRMIGYENRALKNEDFSNDLVDSGELPSGLSATLMYEITMSDQNGMHEELRYKRKEATTTSSSKNIEDNEIAYLKIRYKEPGEDESKLINIPVTKDMFVSQPSNDTRFALSVAGFSQLLKKNDYVGGEYTFDKVIEDLERLDLDYEKGKFLSEVKTVSEFK